MTRASDLAKLLGAGATILDGTTISTADNTAQLELVSTDADSGIGPHQVFYRNSSSPADADLLCELDFRGRNDNSQDVNYATINVKASDVSDGTEDGEYILQVMTAGSVDTTMHIKPAEIVFNEDSIDRDFRVEGNGDANALFVEGETDNVGVGTNDPASKMTVSTGVNSSTRTFLVDNAHSGGSMYNALGVYVGATDRLVTLSADYGDSIMAFQTAGSERLRLDSSGRLLVGLTSASGSASAVLQARGTGASAAVFDRTTDGVVVGFKRNGGNDVGNISITSSNTAYNTSSDYRLKENVTTSWDATTRLKQLKPSRFNFIIDADKTVDGFIAHEVSSIVPEAITGTKDEVDDDGNPVYQGIDQSKLVPLLVKTIQELEARITALESA